MRTIIISIKLAGLGLIATALLTTASFGELYSNSFEYDDWNAAVADGWSHFGANEPTITFPTSVVDTGALPTDGDQVLRIHTPINGGIRQNIFEEDINEYVISFDWYVVNPRSSVSGAVNGDPATGTGRKGYDTYFQLLSEDLSTGVEFRAFHINTTIEVEPGVSQPNANFLQIRRMTNGSTTGHPSDHGNYPVGGEVRQARHFQEGWNQFAIYASEHPELGGDWLRFYLNGEYVGESNANWFGWDGSFTTIGFGWGPNANPATPASGANVGYFDNFTVTELPVGLPGDFDGDGIVDGHDFLTWQRDQGIGDLGDWEANFGTTPGGNGAVAAVPEPSAICLALLAMLWCQRRAVSVSDRRN